MNTSHTVPALIRERALAHPDRTAVESGDQSLTFGRLLHDAERIAQRLRAAGVTREDIVACCVPRGLATVTTTLGVWLAAGALLPIDPSAPPTRTEHMLRDSGAKVAILDAADDPALLATFTRHVDEILDVDAPVLTGPDAVAAEAGSSDLAYVIYTSGSTGLPKGVLVEHGSLADMAAAHESVLYPAGVAESRRVTLNAVTTADTFFSDLVNLAAGRTLVIADETTRRDPERLARFLVDRGIDVFDGTPTQLRMLLLSGHADALRSLKVLIVGNEPTDLRLWSTLRNMADVRVYNFYGPTECTVDVTFAALADSETPTIGRPLPGTEIWLVDTERHLVPDGEVGEICVTGPCLARGYLNAGDADAARFVQLATEPGGPTTRAYLTGDKARRTPSGQLEFLGRVDDQVKIAGYRVEPREVEAALRTCEGVLDAAVAVRDRDGVASLAAWAVLDAGVSADEIVSALKKKLPYYMIPQLTQVPTVPMNASGKADIDALLPEAVEAAASETDGCAGPSDGSSDALEATLSAIWCDVLGTDSVRATDDFFAVGGDSLKATRLIVAVREAVEVPVPIRIIFDNSAFGTFVGAVSQKVEV